jgi:hypothetical protein
MLFPYRSLISLPRPVIDERQLQHIESMPVRQIRPEFEDKLEILRVRVGNNLKPKRIAGNIVTLGDFIKLTE